MHTLRLPAGVSSHCFWCAGATLPRCSLSSRLAAQGGAARRRRAVTVVPARCACHAHDRVELLCGCGVWAGTVELRIATVLWFGGSAGGRLAKVVMYSVIYRPVPKQRSSTGCYLQCTDPCRSWLKGSLPNLGGRRQVCSIRYQGELLGRWDPQNRGLRRKHTPPEKRCFRLADYHPPSGVGVLISGHNI